MSILINILVLGAPYVVKFLYLQCAEVFISFSLHDEMKSVLIFVSALICIGFVASRKYTFLTITYTVTRRERKRKKLNEKFVSNRKQYLRPS